MSIYSENIAAIERNYSSLAKTLKHLKDDYSVKIRSTMVKNMPTCTLDLGVGESCGTLNTTDNPLEEARRFLELSVGTEQTTGLVILSGIGMGYYLQALYEKKLAKGALVLAFEPNMQLFKKFIENRLINITVNNQNMNVFDYPGVRFMVGVAPEAVYSALYEIVQRAGKDHFAGVEFIEHPKLIRTAKAYFKPVYREVARAFYDVRSSYGNDPGDSWSGVDHQFMNIETILHHNGVERLRGKFKGVPAVIAATGPSLNKNIHLLDNIKNKAVFFGADASLNTFLNYNPVIEPDIVCSLERNLTTKNHFAQISDDKKHLMKDMWLAACPVVRPEVYEEWHGKHIIVFRDFAHFKWLGLDKDKGILNTGKSVTNLAFVMAHHMGCSPIILVGQDLAFAPDGGTHVKGADHASKGLRESKLMIQKCKVKGNNGEELSSLDTWVGMRRRFEKDIQVLGIDCINATEGGAFIKGARVMRFQDAIDQYITKDADVKELLNNNLSPLDSDTINRDRAGVKERVNKGLEYYKLSLDNIAIAKDSMEEYFSRVLNDDVNASDIDKILQYAEELRFSILQHEMCYHAAMHIIQSWNLGQGNIKDAIDRGYSGTEAKMMRLIKLFEFFYGLEILFKTMNDGVRESYYDSRSHV